MGRDKGVDEVLVFGSCCTSVLTCVSMCVCVCVSVCVCHACTCECCVCVVCIHMYVWMPMCVIFIHGMPFFYELY